MPQRAHRPRETLVTFNRLLAGRQLEGSYLVHLGADSEGPPRSDLVWASLYWSHFCSPYPVADTGRMLGTPPSWGS